MVDQYDDGRKKADEDPLKPLNSKKIPDRKVAVALTESETLGHAPLITAAGRGNIAEQIMQLAKENGINIREDKALSEMLAKIELDSPIPSEAFLAVAEILSYVYRANGKKNPFDTRISDDDQEIG
ncbi:MAG: EscU/YscU/HrcU family type III secretion system export apparatus switch protein [Bdellovibrionales bacterium]